MNQPAQTSGTAVASLVFGIVSWVALPVIGAIVAIICGHIARSEIRRVPAGTVQGDGLALAGLILGYAHLVIAALVLLAVVLLGVAIFGFL
jgi:hypothetical protein